MSRRHAPRRERIVRTCPCGAPALEAFVCHWCMDRYHGQLARVPSVARDLELERARQARKGDSRVPIGRSGGESPLPYVEAASDALSALRATLVSACRALVLDGELPADAIDAMATWLAERETAIPLRPEGPDIVAELDDAMARALRVIDTPPEQVLRGRCACDAELRAPRHATTVRCPGCGTVYDGQALDAYRDAAVRDHLASWEELAAYAASSLGIPRGTVRGWRRRGRLTPTPGGLYRVGDMLDLAGVI